jgi:protein-S-isoprenylcysteine O-methyltransferase Ste14
MYGGVVLIGLAGSLADAPLGLVPTALLAVLFDLKARREEARPIERFPEYAAYRHARRAGLCLGSTDLTLEALPPLVRQ